MSELREILGVFFIAAGVFFFVVGVAGLVRFPDVYMRIHASGKVSMLGIVSLLIGTAFIFPATILQAIALIIFYVAGTPVASHAVAAAAYRSGVPMAHPHRDDLAAVRKADPAPATPDPDGDESTPAGDPV